MDFHERLEPEQIDRLRRRYEETDETVSQIANDEGLTERRLHELRRRYDWKSRRPRVKAPVSRKPRKATTRPARVALARAEPARPTVEPQAGVSMIERVRALLEQALDAAQAQIADQPPEATTRFTVSLTRSLAMLKALEEDSAKNAKAIERAGEPPLDLAELRRELARRLDRLREEREGS